MALCLDHAVRSNEASSFGAAGPALATLIQELATFFLPDMLKMLKALGILVHYKDKLPPAFGGTATNLSLAPATHAPPVASAPMPSPPVLPMLRTAPCAPPQPPCSLLCPSALPSFAKVAASKVSATSPLAPSKSSIYTKVGTCQGTHATVAILWPTVLAGSSPPSMSQFVETKPLGDCLPLSSLVSLHGDWIL